MKLLKAEVRLDSLLTCLLTEKLLLQELKINKDFKVNVTAAEITLI